MELWLKSVAGQAEISCLRSIGGAEYSIAPIAIQPVTNILPISPTNAP